MCRSMTAVLFASLLTAHAAAQMIGVNIILNQPPSASVVAQLEAYGQVLDAFPEINAIRVRAYADDLAAIQSLACVAAAKADAPCAPASMTEEVTVPDFAAGATLWNLDATNVTDSTMTRTVSYDGSGVYIAVVDSGLQHNWREYFPEERIATQFGMAFSGGGADLGDIPTVPNTWELDTNGHGTKIASVLLGFSYFGPYFNGVAPRSTIIPIRIRNEAGTAWNSKLAKGILYAASLKATGALGGAPLVINLCIETTVDDPLIHAAIGYAIAHGVIVVSAAGNQGDAGMSYPGAYPEVISVAATGWVSQWPADDPTAVLWIERDVLEGDPLEHFIAVFSARELPGQDLDVAAPGTAVPVAWTWAGQADHSYFFGTSASGPHVAGVVALMLQKNPALTQAQIETILESTAMPIAPGCRQVIEGGVGPGGPAVWSNPVTSTSSGVFFFPMTVCWGANATGHGLLQADAALNATPTP
jgi:subtilisin family serine protease